MAEANPIDVRPDDGVEIETLSQCSICGSSAIIPIDPANRICRCGHCGYVFDNPRPTLQAIVAFYSQMGKYDSWLEEEEDRGHLWKRRLNTLKRHRSSGSLLDVGTGTGQFLSIARECFVVKGTEVSESAVRIATERYGLDVLRGQIEDVQFSSGFDVVTLFHVLEHVPDPLATLRRCRELLNPGGILVAAVPNDIMGTKSIVRRALALAGVGRFRGRRCGLARIRLDGSLAEIHLSHFTPAVLRQLVERSGLRVVSEGLDPYRAAAGINRTADDLHRATCSLVFNAFGVNLYDAMMVVAELDERRQNGGQQEAGISEGTGPTPR